MLKAPPVYRVFRIGVNANYKYLYIYLDSGVKGNWIKTSWTKSLLLRNRRCSQFKELSEDEIDGFIMMKELVS